jgi:hypothetical protein
VYTPNSVHPGCRIEENLQHVVVKHYYMLKDKKPLLYAAFK